MRRFHINENRVQLGKVCFLGILIRGFGGKVALSMGNNNKKADVKTRVESVGDKD